MSKARDYRSQTLDNSATGCFLITPNDNTDLTIYPIALRIWNPNSTTATISLQTVAGSDIVLSVPALSLLSEPIYTARVLSTGTTGTLVIHGYY